MTDLARLLVLDRSALAHNLKPLVRDGYVRTTRDLRDGRSRRVALTDAGCEKLTQSRRLWTDAQARFEAAYGAERAVALRRALAEIFSGISRWRSAGARDGRGQRLMVSAP